MKLKLLGEFELQSSNQRTVPIVTLKGRALLAYLACAKGRVASRDSLALLLWSDSDSRKSKQNLRQVLFKLSHVLAQHNLPILCVEDQSISLRTENLWVDTWELDSLAVAESLAALGRVGSLYQGEFLEGLSLDAPVFGDWLTDMRAHFQNRALNGLHLLLERQREAGDFHDAISTGLRTLEIDSTQEQIHCVLMELYLAKGMPGAALNQYRTCRFVLRRDLDVEPDAETESLYQKIRVSKSEPRPTPSSHARTPVTPPRGRAEELISLQDSFIEASNHGARLLAIRGEAGIGKTHLIDAFTRQLESQKTFVCRVAARQAEGQVPLGLWRQAFDSLLQSRELMLSQEESGLREVPLLYGTLHGTGDAADLPLWSHVRQNRYFEGVLERLVEKSETLGPIVVVLEDIQWADTDSLRGLGRVIRSLRQAPILFVTTARLWPEMNSASIVRVFHDLDRAGLVRHCDLPPLSFDDSMALLDEALAEHGQTAPRTRKKEQLWDFAEGNPALLLAGLTPSALSDALALPANLRHSAQQALGRMSSSTKALVQVASLAHSPLGIKTFALAAGQELQKVAMALDELTAENVLRKSDGKFSIARAWFGRAVYGHLPLSQQRAMHAAIASAIRAVEAPDLTSHFAALAHHSRAAGENSEAAGYRLSNLEVSVARGTRRGVSKALIKLVRCLPERPSDPKMNTVLWRAGFLRAAIAEAEKDPQSTLHHLRALERRGPRNDSPKAAVALTYALSRACCVAGDRDEGLRYARRTLRLSAGQSGAGGPWKLPERLLFRSYLHVPAAADVISGLKGKAQQAREKNAWSSVSEIATAQAMMEGLAGRVTEMRDSFRVARAAVAQQPEPWAEASLLQIEGMAQNWTGGGEQAIAVLGKALDLTNTGGDLIRSCIVRGLRGQAYLAHGLLEEAKANLEQTISEAGALGSIPYLPLFYCWLAEISGRSGRRDDAIEQAHHAWRLSYGRGQTWTRAPILRSLARGLAHARRPNIAAAERAVREAIAIHRSMGIRIGLVNSQVAHAEIRRAAGDAAGSRVLFREAREMRRHIGVKGTPIESLAQ